MYFSTNNLGYVGGGHTQGKLSRGPFGVPTSNEHESVGAIGRHNTSQGYGMGYWYMRRVDSFLMIE